MSSKKERAFLTVAVAGAGAEGDLTSSSGESGDAPGHWVSMQREELELRGVQYELFGE